MPQCPECNDIAFTTALTKHKHREKARFFLFLIWAILLTWAAGMVCYIYHQS